MWGNFVMWCNDSLLHICDVEQFAILHMENVAPHDKFTMYAVLSLFGRIFICHDSRIISVWSKKKPKNPKYKSTILAILGVSKMFVSFKWWTGEENA